MEKSMPEKDCLGIGFIWSKEEEKKKLGMLKELFLDKWLPDCKGAS